VSKDKQGSDQHAKIHDDSHAELRVIHHGSIEANCPRHIRRPQRVERPAEGKVGADHGQRLRDEDGDDAVTEPLLKRHDADAHVLQQDGELEGHVSDDVEEDSADGHLPLAHELLGTDGLYVATKPVEDGFGGFCISAEGRWPAQMVVWEDIQMPMNTDMMMEHVMAAAMQ